MITSADLIFTSETYRLGTHPNPTAEMKVPANAKVRMTPKFLKKFSCGDCNLALVKRFASLIFAFI